MRIPVPEHPSGQLTDAWRFCVGTGRFELRSSVDDEWGNAVVDETPPWWGESRLLGTTVEVET